MKDFANVLACAFLFSLVTFVALFLIWWTGILLDIKTVRWCLQFNAIAVPTLGAATLAAAIIHEEMYR